MSFTKNGKLLGVAFSSTQMSPLHPAIGLSTPGEAVSCNFGQDPFIFDLEGYVQVPMINQLPV